MGKIMVLGLGLVLAGCTTMQLGDRSDLFTDKGLPNERYMVGGGFEIDFDAPCDGTAYLVDVSVGRYIKTEYLDFEESFYFPDYVVEQLLEDGEVAKVIDLRLYFIPAENAADADGRFVEK
ncbi:MAG: hypothetical protein JXR40_04500 [Pontiellaceae bacterium]|nr:hypothetical protein [Pontiellaceae bacterium]